jgi:hypothetical protein
MYEKFMVLPSFSSTAKNAKAVLKNEAIIAVLASSIVAPFVIPQINKILDGVPILKDHKSLASFATGMVIFSLAPMFKMPMLRAVVIGVAGAFILSSLLPIYSNLTTRNGGA